jgi:low temperature requirement protein LtrA
VVFYDKAHRRLNRPYTILFLVSFGLILATLFLSQPYIRIMFFLALLLNYLPPFVSYFLLRRKALELTLSSSMTERLGLFTIIIFGEVVLGVINGVIALHHLDTATWLRFVIAISIVFTLWWLFFTMVSDRKCKPGLRNSSLFELLFIPTLIGLGLLASSFSGLFTYYDAPVAQATRFTRTFGFSISLFLLGIWAMMSFMEYPEIFLQFKKSAKQAFFAAAVVIAAFTWPHLPIALVFYLLIVLMILIDLILYLNGIWFRMMKKAKAFDPKR